MKKFLIFALCIAISASLSAQIKVLKPAGVFKIPNISKAEYLKAADSPNPPRTIELNPIFSVFYSNSCSWYCGGQVGRITASSSLQSQGKYSYGAENLHDFDHETAWVEGKEGYGIGEYITYEFPYRSPRVTTINIHNGYVKSDQAWLANSRVKKLKVYYNDVPYAILLLENSRSLQWFDVGVLGNHPSPKNAKVWTLKFEILEVWPGTKYKDTAISDIYFDGIDVH